MDHLHHVDDHEDHEHEEHHHEEHEHEEHHHEGELDEDEDSFSASPKRGKKRKENGVLRKAPQAPKRFKSSYICFFMAKQPEIKSLLGDKATVTELSRRSAEMWYVHRLATRFGYQNNRDPKQQAHILRLSLIGERFQRRKECTGTKLRRRTNKGTW